MTSAHTFIAQACLGFLLHIDDDITEDGLEKLPLVKYAAEHWVGHARFEDVSSFILDELKYLFDPEQSPPGSVGLDLRSSLAQAPTQ